MHHIFSSLASVFFHQHLWDGPVAWLRGGQALKGPWSKRCWAMMKMGVSCGNRIGKMLDKLWSTELNKRKFLKLKLMHIFRDLWASLSLGGFNCYYYYMTSPLPSTLRTNTSKYEVYLQNFKIFKIFSLLKIYPDFSNFISWSISKICFTIPFCSHSWPFSTSHFWAGLMGQSHRCWWENIGSKRWK